METKFVIHDANGIIKSTLKDANQKSLRKINTTQIDANLNELLKNPQIKLAVERLAQS
ncbi:hypothetical protein KTT66_03255 [Lacticaseibacillus casei]|jgi:hypothetical protein|uniref:Uncharacterized protein n=1 Tax=Lacticaseibacillus huelsenbergensis TaxID=3035291 RepID=A0ABY8DQA1_9LACO|nr:MULTISPECIES: hypothetical protein [Lacticaseibacillus]MDG3061863.1 hypothetical protein [Lacticaseibacillus sp. BCRC 81376]QVI38070.1 hypothetical protein KGS74_03570 [Lacticaseibacillus casei]QXG59855.1 hypothetical protein KTT66_03255 [Lacticaseibacillus casei]WFB38672.1 hypothetical protein LHUE1_002210 [Lacticaseibacillus huelsenbergensis]WFB43067.1 hypothetical protein LHUE2_001132 [Lacticaseibacillus huelsenbergensis]